MYSAPVKGEFPASIVDSLRLEQKDIPEGYMFGLIPNGLKGTLQSNPWRFNQSAINRLTPHIYPGGDPTKIDTIHFSIVTRKEAPYDDEIVCYLLVFKTKGAADKEMSKIKEFGEMNKDRVFFSIHENIVLLMHVDDTEDYSLMRSLAETIEGRFPKTE